MAHDAAVIGLGAMGSAALYQLAKSGANVLGIDRFSPPHDQGSSHGDTRVTRLAIGEGAHYTPLVKRSHEIWRDLERQTGAELLTQCGELIISSENPSSRMHVSQFFPNTVDAARGHGVAHELLDAAQIRRRFPQFNIADHEFGYFEPDAGFVRPEACITAQLSLAEKYGAEIRRGETVLGFDVDADGVSIRTDKGNHKADKIIVANGAWLPKFLGGDFENLLSVYRQVLYWFELERGAPSYDPAHFPVFIWELPKAHQGIYGFPSIDGTSVKIATEQYADIVSPNAVNRQVSKAEASAMYHDLVAAHLNGVSARCANAVACLYTVTPDAGFIIDTLPASERVIVASCCSGHGFKHSAAIGEILRDLALTGRSSTDLSPFRLARFG